MAAKKVSQKVASQKVGADAPEVPKRARVSSSPWEVYLKALRVGMTERGAAAMAGVSKTTITRWVNDDPAKQAAEDEARETYLDSLRVEIEDAARTKERDAWKAAAWLLERRDPDRWKQRTASELTGKEGGPVQVATVVRFPVNELGGVSDDGDE